MKSNLLKRGDVLLVHNKDRQHTAVYLGDNKIASARINEKGTTTGGTPGDQTGREICISAFDPSYPWETVLRYRDEVIAEGIAVFMENIAKDDSHGYDQLFRWNEKGDFDCSSLVITACEAVNIPVKAKGATYTGNMKSTFKKAGFVEVNMNETEKPKEEVPTVGNTYTVVKGDTLSSIAKKHNTTVSALVKANNIKDPDLIYIGQKIIISGSTSAPEKPKTITGTVNTKTLPLRVRQQPNTKSRVLRLLPKGSKVEIQTIKDGWGQLVNGGFVCMDYIKT